jgi:hypothetical protein
MLRMLSPIVDSVVKMDFRENFTNNVLDIGAINPGIFFIALLLVLVIDVGIVYLLWNNVIVNVITIAKPIKSIWTAAGLLIFLLIIHS